MNNKNSLIENIENLHTTDLGAVRIRRNLSLGETDVTEWCKGIILSPDARIERLGKNYYVKTLDLVITVNSSSYTIITAHRIRN